MVTEKQRFAGILNSFGTPIESQQIFKTLLESYSKPNRYYHNFNHIISCLNQFDRVKNSIQNVIEVELALWFHDIVYNTKSNTNETDSANLAKNIFSQTAIPANAINKITRLILATQHIENSKDNDEQLIIDIDLSILGAGESIFNQYEANIRKEYHWVSTIEYCTQRTKILNKFMQKKQIFQSIYFNNKFEEQARINITNLIEKLKQGIN